MDAQEPSALPHRPQPDWTPAGVAVYLATLVPFVLVFIAGAVGWTIAPLEHLRPTPANVAAGAATLVLGLAIVRWRWGARQHAPGSVTVIPEFEPPDEVLPAEADVLIRGRPGRRDVTATIIDLALRSFLRIEEGSSPRARRTWVLERGAASVDELRDYERVALAGLFAHGSKIELVALAPRFFVVADLVQEELERDVVRQGWFAGPPGRLRSRWATAGWVLALAGIAVTFVLGNTLGLGLVGAAVTAVGVVVYATSPWRPARTPAGEALARRVAGFRLFLRTAEAARQRYAEKERIFEDYLPFAIAFGFVEGWVHGFGLVDRPGDFEEDTPGPIPLGAELVGLVRQLDEATDPAISRG